MREPKPKLKPPVDITNAPDNVKINLKDVLCQFLQKPNENNIFYNGNNFIILAGSKIIVNNSLTPSDEVVDTVSIDGFEVIFFVYDDDVLQAIKRQRQNSRNTNRVNFVTEFCEKFCDFETQFSIDSLKIRIPREYVSVVDVTKLVRVSYSTVEGHEYDKLVYYGSEGLKYVEIDDSEVVIETSAKVLRDNYVVGLTLKTLDEFFERINEVGVIKIHDKAIEHAEVLRCDVTNNVEVDDKRKYFKAFALIENAHYIKEIYGTRKKISGVVFRRKVKTYKERIIIYDKAEELKNNAKWLEDFENIVRVEQNITSLKRIRKIFGISNNKLISVLSSNSHPNYELLEKIVQEAKPKSYIVEAMNARQFKDFCFINYLREHYSEEEARILLFEKMSINTAYKYIKHLKQLKDSEMNLKKVKEFLELLKGTKDAQKASKEYKT